MTRRRGAPEGLLELRLDKSAHRARALRGHPWAYASELHRPLPGGDDDTAVLLDPRGRLLGAGLYNPQSQIAWRRYSPEARPLDEALLDAAIGRAVRARAPEPARRLVWSEGDDLPGLVVDQYGEVLVVQLLTRGMDARRDAIMASLRRATGLERVVLRNDAPSRAKEGLPLGVEATGGALPPPGWVEVEGLELFVDLTGGHKTGLYLDQRREQRALARELPAGARVLDAFCNQGGFALQAKRAGAGRVVGVDLSAEAIGVARKNADRNGLEVELVVGDAFDDLRARERAGERYELVVVDPPGFAPKRAALPSALRGYKELNLRALRMVVPGGRLATYSCSRACDRTTFQGVLEDAAADAGGTWRVVRATTQPPDHPIRLGVPETEYLKGFVLERG